MKLRTAPSTARYRLEELLVAGRGRAFVLTAHDTVQGVHKVMEYRYVRRGDLARSHDLFTHSGGQAELLVWFKDMKYDLELRGYV